MKIIQIRLKYMTSSPKVYILYIPENGNNLMAP